MPIKLFQNILAYRHDLSLTPRTQAGWQIETHEAMAERAAEQPHAGLLSSSGFIRPFGGDDFFIQRIAPATFVLAVRTFERLLPAKVVRNEVEARARRIENAEGRKCYAREKQRIKDEVIQDFLPRTFIDFKDNYVLIKGQHIYIDSSSAKRGDEILCLLREVFGSLPVRPVEATDMPIASFTQWMTLPEEDNGLPQFELTGDFRASGGSDETDLLTGKGVSLVGGSMSGTLTEQGRRVTQLGLIWESERFGQTVSFTINEMLGMKGIKWDKSMSDLVSDEIGECEDDNDRAILEMRATFLMLSDQIAELWADLLTALGGEKLPESHLAEEDEDDLV